jgi:two-component system phosphate regulon response regulator PhoB
MRNAEPASVLLVDDAPDEREMYAEFLRTLGYRTFEAGSAAEARALARDLRPSVIVADVMMKGPGDGFTLTGDLKQDDRTRDIPVVLLTGRAFESDREAAARAGCDLFLTKPCLPDELAARIAHLLGNQQLRDVRGRAVAAPAASHSQDLRRRHES